MRQGGYGHVMQARRHYNAALRRAAVGMRREEGFDCFSLCNACGRLHAAERCPSCGHAFSVDLAVHQNFYSLLEAEDEQPELRSRKRWQVVSALGGLAATLVLCAATYLGASSAVTVPALLGAPIAFLASAARGSAPHFDDPPTRGLAPRWIGPGPLPTTPLGKAPVMARGEFRPGELLQSPFAGLPCAAYLVSVCGPDGVPLLVEQANAAGDVGGHRVAANAAWVSVRQHELELEVRENPDLEKWCRARGLALEGGSLLFFEGRVEALAAAQLRVSDEGVMLEEMTGDTAGSPRVTRYA